MGAAVTDPVDVARADVRQGLGDDVRVWFFARPEGQTQLLGSWLAVWDDLLPEFPAPLAEPDATIVASALVASDGGRRGPLAS